MRIVVLVMLIAGGLIASGPTPQGTLVVVLDVVPDSPADFAFDESGVSRPVFVLDDDADPTLSNTEMYQVTPGAHLIRALTNPLNTDLTDVVCVDPTGDSHTVFFPGVGAAVYEIAPGETVTCTFTYVTRGGLDIVKDARPDTSRGFHFTATHHPGLLLFGTESLNPSSLPNLNLVPGTYTVTEAPSRGWPLVGIECNDPDAGTTIDLATGTAVVDIDPGEIITCTFINEKSPETVALHDPITGRWALRNSAGAVRTITYGDPFDQPFMGDWDCDGVDTPGLFRPVATFVGPAGKVYLRNSNTTGVADVEYFFGDPGDIAVPGDWDGDGCDTVAIFRPSTGAMYVTNRLGSGNLGLGAAEMSFDIGTLDSPPLAGDFDGDEDDEFGYFVPGPQGPQFHLADGLTAVIPKPTASFGDAGDVGLVGDWNGDGVTTIAAFRPTSGEFYLRNTNTTGAADLTVSAFGDAAWTPLHGVFGLG